MMIGLARRNEIDITSRTAEGVVAPFEKMRDELLNETLFFGLEHARSVVAEWVADDNAGRPPSALRYQTPAAFAAQLTAMGDRLHETDAFRRSPIDPAAQAGNFHPPALVSDG